MTQLSHRLDDVERYLVNKISNFPDTSTIGREWLAVICLLTDSNWHLSEEHSLNDKIRLRYREYVMAELIRLRWDSKFRFKALNVSVPKVNRQLHKLEANLWYRVLNLVQEVFLWNSLDYPHPASWFGTVLIETRLVGPFSTDLNKSLFFRQLRRENIQLLTG